VAVEATQTVGNADPGAEDEGCALIKHSAGEVERCYRILRWMLDELPYLARQLSVFYRHTHRVPGSDSCDCLFLVYLCQCLLRVERNAV
jgi:hypothetical protein